MAITTLFYSNGSKYQAKNIGTYNNPIWQCRKDNRIIKNDTYKKALVEFKANRKPQGSRRSYVPTDARRTEITRH